MSLWWNKRLLLLFIIIIILYELYPGAPFQHMPGVGKTAHSGINRPPLANCLLSYTLEIEKPGVYSQIVKDS